MSKCKITVLKKYYDPELAAEYCANPDPGACSVFTEGQEIIIDRDAYFSMKMPDKFCAEAWHCINHYVYSALQGGALMEGWSKDRDTLIACCNDGVRPVVFKLERVDDE